MNSANGKPIKKRGLGEWVISDPGIEDKRLFVLDEEFANALSATKREGNTLSSILRCLYDDGNAEPLTKSYRIKTTGAHVGIVTHITLFELNKRMSENEQLNGFGNRFLWVCSRRNGVIPFPEQMAEGIKAELRRKIQNRLDAARTRGRFEFSEDAKALWQVEYPRLSMSHGGLAGCMVNRGEAQVIRLSLVYALLAGHEKIQREDLIAAIAFWQYCHDSAFFIFGCAPADRRKLKILESLKTRDGQRMTKNEIRKDVFDNHIEAGNLTKLLDEMVSDHLVDVQSEPTGGAPRTVVIFKNASVKSVKSVKSPPVDTLNTLNTQEEKVFSTDELDDFVTPDTLEDFDIDAEVICGS